MDATYVFGPVQGCRQCLSTAARLDTNTYLAFSQFAMTAVHIQCLQQRAIYVEPSRAMQYNQHLPAAELPKLLQHKHLALIWPNLTMPQGNRKQTGQGGWVKPNPGDPTALIQICASLCTAPIHPPTFAPNKLKLNNADAATTCLAAGLMAPYKASRLHATGSCQQASH